MGSAGPPPARNARLSRGARTGRSESGGVTSHERAYKTKAQPAPNLCRLCHPLSTCRLASRWKEDMAFPRSFYVAGDIWRFAWSLVGCLLALSWLPTHTRPT